MIEKNIVANDGHNIQTYIWPNEQAKAWVHILHGMAEHAARYDEFAQSLVAAGYAVVAHNHRGHGTSEGTMLGTYAKSNGWQRVLNDISSVRDDVCADELPYFIMAHSMGSFIAQSYVTKQHKTVAGMVLSGSNLQPVGLSRVAKTIAKIESFRVGKQKSSDLLQFLSFGSFNKEFKPNRTEYDWLSRDDEQVDKYVADSLCGFACSTGLWQDFLAGLIDLFTPTTFAKIPTNLPIFIVSGSQDPVGQMGKGTTKLLNAYKANGQKNISLKLFENARHEILNEVNKDEVTTDIINWLEKQ